METGLNNQQDLKKNPFKFPEGYFEGLTSQIMDQIPEKIIEEPRKVTLMDRVRPWVYMAAMFAGLGLFFRLFVGTGDSQNGIRDSLLVQTSFNTTEIYSEFDSVEDQEYWEYIENQYMDYLLTEELSYFE